MGFAREFHIRALYWADRRAKRHKRTMNSADRASLAIQGKIGSVLNTA